MTVSAFPNIPAENALIKLNRRFDVGGWNLHVTNLAVTYRGRHELLLAEGWLTGCQFTAL
jgi:hypothetical protein